MAGECDEADSRFRKQDEGEVGGEQQGGRAGIPCLGFSKKTDVSIGGGERPRWSTMASNRIYIPGEPVFTPANHPEFRPRTEAD